MRERERERETKTDFIKWFAERAKIPQGLNLCLLFPHFSTQFLFCLQRGREERGKEERGKVVANEE